MGGTSGAFDVKGDSDLVVGHQTEIPLPTNRALKVKGTSDLGFPLRIGPPGGYAYDPCEDHGNATFRRTPQTEIWRASSVAEAGRFRPWP